MKKQILFIDDHDATRKLLSHYLGQFYEIIEIESAVKAIIWLNSGNKPDAIILDLMMPVMNGIQFLKHINKTGITDAPIIVISAIETSSHKLECFALGAKDFIVKPFNPEEVKMRINNQLNYKQDKTLH
jgi:DNA-binding response OmpR family regulator